MDDEDPTASTATSTPPSRNSDVSDPVSPRTAWGTTVRARVTRRTPRSASSGVTTEVAPKRRASAA